MNTATVKRELPRLLHDLGARSLLDAPCGDLNWIKDVDLGLDRYIADPLVMPNSTKVSRKKIWFASPTEATAVSPS